MYSVLLTKRMTSNLSIARDGYTSSHLSARFKKNF
uniref:Uncharacterized protein n=1 Tax=Arundo donax TaxID=35708 RepID=A0A0A9GKB2_ARUDO